MLDEKGNAFDGNSWPRIMAGKSFTERIASLEKPDEASDTQEIWATIKTVLVILRVLLFVAIIAVSEILENHFFKQLSFSVWSLIIGIPLFILLSVIIINGDKKFDPAADKRRRESTDKFIEKYSEPKTALKHPIRKRK